MEDAITASVGARQQQQSTPVDIEWMSALVDNSPEAMLLLNQNGSILYVNEAMSVLVGRTKETLRQLGRTVLVDPEDKRWEVACREREEKGQFRGELNMLHHDGTKIPVEINSKVFTNSQGAILTSVHVRDLREYYVNQQKISEQKESLEATLRDLQLVLENSLDLICTFDLAGNILQMNNACQGILGYAPHGMVGQNYKAFIHPEDVANTITDASMVKAKGGSSNFRNRYIHKNGSVVHLSWSSSLLVEEKKVFCVARDKTEVLVKEIYQEKAEERIQALLSQGADMIAVLSASGDYIFTSTNAKRITGYSPEEFIGKSAFEFIHPDDISMILKAFEEVTASNIVETKPFRFKTASGEWRWVETTATNCLADPNINGIIANSRDITDRKLADLKLQESEQRYKTLFYHNPDAVYSFNPEGYYTSGNKVTLELFGLTEEELQKKHLFDFVSPEKFNQVQEEFNKVLSGQSVFGESVLKGSDNRIRYFNYTEIPIIINGNVVGVYGIAKDITATKEQQFQLEASAKRLENTLESIKDAFFTINLNWKFTYVNKEFERLMSISRESLLGLDFRDVFPVDHFSASYRPYQEVLAEQKPVHFETRYQPADLWVDVSAYPSEEGVSVYFRGINERKKAEDELKKLSLVASKTVNSVYITDEQARIEWVNEGFTRLTGYTLEEVLGRRPGDFLAGPATNTAKVSSIREKLTSDKPFVQEVQNKSKAGDIYWSKLDVTPILDKETGGGKKFIVIETEITAQKKAEEERLQLTEELLRRNQHLEQFTYIVSHNLRSPVANVLGLTSLLGTTDNPELRKGLTERLQKTALNLDTIIRDLNDLLSLRAGAVEAKETILLQEVLDQALEVLPSEFVKQVKVELNGVQEVNSVRSYLSSILTNLLTNAMKYQSPDRPLEIVVKADWAQNGQMLCLTVQDNGLGINLAKEGKNLFGLYKRFHFHVAGRGLGLYLVKTQAETLGGHVSVESEPGVGSTFKVCLPKG